MAIPRTIIPVPYLYIKSFEDGAFTDGIYGCGFSNKLQWFDLILDQDSSSDNGHQGDMPHYNLP